MEFFWEDAISRMTENVWQVVWRQVLWGTGLQFVLGLAVLRWKLGRDVTQCISDKITRFLDFTKEGSAFVYGYLVTGNTSAGPVFAFSVRPLICILTQTLS